MTEISVSDLPEPSTLVGIVDHVGSFQSSMNGQNLLNLSNPSKLSILRELSDFEGLVGSIRLF